MPARTPRATSLAPLAPCDGCNLEAASRFEFLSNGYRELALPVPSFRELGQVPCLKSTFFSIPSTCHLRRWIFDSKWAKVIPSLSSPDGLCDVSQVPLLSQVRKEITTKFLCVFFSPHYDSLLVLS